MGFSVSASTAIIFVALFVSAGALYSAFATGGERLVDAHATMNEEALQRQNTALTVLNATYFPGNDTVRVVAANRGSTALSVDRTDLLVGNDYADGASERVLDASETDLWLPGERLVYEVTRTASPDLVTVVTEQGVTDTGVV
ncbi:MAG: hypothetical protein ABEJ08_03465 [Halobacteriaceae archaeon]